MEFSLNPNERTRVKVLKDILWVVAFTGLVAGIGRFVNGLAATSNMTDGVPWGLWKIYNMVGGAALATSGFVVAAIIYAFKLEKYRPVVRLSVLIGFLGYGASLTALLFDIGLPHRGWHPFLMWNPHSFLFEVFWCVSIYWMVTAYEIVPVVLERFPFPRLVHFLHAAALPIVFLGITLSTMHHSSLGSLFMVSPTRLHPLWFSLFIPVQFFTSAMGAGLATIVLAVIVYGWLYNKKPNLPVLEGLAKASAVLLLVYIAIRFADLTFMGGGRWNYVFGENQGWESGLFMAEVLLQVFVPAFIFLVPGLRRNVPVLTAGAASAFIGLTMHRLDVGFVGYFRDAGTVYIPSLSEFALSLGVLAAAGIVALFLLEHFHIMDSPEECGADDHHEHHGLAADQFTLEEAKKIAFSPRAFRAGATAVAVIPLTMAVFFLTNQNVVPFKPIAQPVETAQGADALRAELILNGDRDDMAVKFPHDFHKAVMETWATDQCDTGDKDCVEKNNCGICHHLDFPGDNASACWRCHTDMLAETNIFDHHGHQARLGGNSSCQKCHELDKDKGPYNFVGCYKCHGSDDQAPMNGMDDERLTAMDIMAPGYKDAMHGSCLTCHRREGMEDMKKKDGLGNCGACHPGGAAPATAKMGR